MKKTYFLTKKTFVSFVGKVHCIVWAKECFKLIFGQANESMLFEDESTGEKSVYMHLISYPQDKTIESINSFAKELVVALFNIEVQKKIDMDVYKTAAKCPVPISLSDIENAAKMAQDQALKHEYAYPMVPGWDTRCASITENISSFILCIHEIAAKVSEYIGKMSFDKDDILAMKFVTAASNIRSHVFGIPMLSFYDAKGIAGNIIPAIATTNAIISGTQVALATKLLTSLPKQEIYAEHTEDSKKAVLAKIHKLFPHTYCARFPNRRGAYLQPSTTDPPQRGCYVCGKAMMTVIIDVNETSLEELLVKVIKGKLGFNEPTLSLGSSTIYEEGEDCDEDLKDNLVRKLVACPAGGVHDGTIIDISDFSQNSEVKLLVRHKSNDELAEIESAATDLFILEGFDASEQQKVSFPDHNCVSHDQNKHLSVCFWVRLFVVVVERGRQTDRIKRCRPFNLCSEQ